MKSFVRPLANKWRKINILNSSSCFILLLFISIGISIINLPKCSAEISTNQGTGTVTEEEEISGYGYSVVNLLPSFKTLMFWRSNERSSSDPESEPKVEELPKSEVEVEYQVQDVIHHHLGHNLDDEKVSSLMNSDPLAATSTMISSTIKPPEELSSKISDRSIFEKFRSGNGPFSTMTPRKNFNRVCHSCSKEYIYKDDNEEYVQRIEFIKAQILTKLGLKEPPRLNNLPDIQLINIYLENTKRDTVFTEFADDNDEDDDFNEIHPRKKKENLEIAYILPNENGAYPPMFNLSFLNTHNDSSKDHGTTIRSISIIVQYKMDEEYYKYYSSYHNSQTDLTIEYVPNLVETKRNSIENKLKLINTFSAKQNENINSLSFEYDVTDLFNDGNHPHHGMIKIYNDNFQILKSFIKVEMTNNKFIRAKRSLDCTGKHSFCCRESLYVNFTTIGWNTWIIHPEGYNAKHCKGKCDFSNSRYYHTTIMEKYPKINICCSPKDMSSLPLIYIDSDYKIYQRILPGMIVQSCDCA